MATIRESIEHWRAAFVGAGVDSPRLTAELLLARVLEVDRGRLLALTQEPLAPAHAAALHELARRRLRREPLAYILGEREFFSRTFSVRPGVLVPRPETETIIELAKRLLPPGQAGWAADVGTGSGCLAVTLALEFPALHVLALDLEPVPVRVAADNARRHGVQARVRCCRGNLLAPVRPGAGLALLVCNPPYIDPAAEADLPPEVSTHEPRTALFSGEHGLQAGRTVLQQARAVLAPGAWLLMEFGADQGPALAKTAALLGYEADLHRDLSGMERVLAARWTSH
ncbi:MAG: peptide chain release factor N(5)-glutamine methyltransferase [Planctomycetes bacterium]|nr:peptide chain release factor N(5)-glutamine methyltransferase [Planctomycetota bacterium]